MPIAVSLYDYYPFGMLMPDRYKSDTSVHTTTLTYNTMVKKLTSTKLSPTFTPVPNSPGAIVTNNISVTPFRNTMLSINNVFFGFSTSIVTYIVEQYGVNGWSRINSATVNYNGATVNIVFTPKTSIVRLKRVDNSGLTVLYSGSGGGGLEMTLENYVLTEVKYEPGMGVATISNKDADKYKFGFNGKLKDNEVAGTGNSIDYEFRMYDSRLGRFKSVDPLASKFPTLTPFQFASNMPIWAMDQDGREALIINTENGKQTLVANVYYVTKGPGSVTNVPALEKEVASLIINRVNAANREAKQETPWVPEIGGVILHPVYKDENGQPLTLESARAMAAKSTINYNDMKGQPQSVQSWKTGVVVKANQGELNSENARFDTETGPGLEGRKTIIIRKFTMNIFKDEDIRKDYVHEFGHFLGVDGHPTGFENTDEGVTSREPKNVILKGTDVLPMLQGAAKEGVMVKGTP